MERSILKPQIDIPLTVRLQKAEGIEKQGRYGVDYQYAVREGTMYLPPLGRDALLKSNAQAGDQVEILKSSRGFSVKVLREGPPICRPRNSEVAPQVNGQAEKPEEHSISVTAKHYMGCLCAAIDAASEAQEYGRERGLGITFLGNDIRTIATTFYIDDQRRGEMR